MSATTLRVIGILFLLAAAVVAVLNLKRVADLRMMAFAAASNCWPGSRRAGEGTQVVKGWLATER